MVTSSSDILSIRSLAKTFAGERGPVHALEGIDLDLASGDTLAILGPTGCGKSSLLFLLAGLLPPSSGDIHFEGRPLTGPHRNIALVLQDYGLFPWKTVQDNIELGLRVRGERIDRPRIARLMSELGIAAKRDGFPQQLSGGQKQRVALARALVLEPTLLLMDEPFAALDTLTRERLQDLCARLWRARAFALVLVTHNIQEAVRLGRRIAIMDTEPGRVRHLIANPTALTEDQRDGPVFMRIQQQIRETLEETA
jgi:NitT/TauT family transport system ATP-binding protein